uniref:receptor protein-tyrosine kinase n=1 Tax=Oreochromis niloticus TaxID=8128 RepID=A0A669CQK1_ORENI
MNIILISVLCGFYGVLAKDKDQKGRFTVPLLDVRSRQLVLDANQMLTLNCRGRWQLTWTFPAGLDRDQVEVSESLCGRTSKHYCSQVKVSGIQAQHTGLFRCRYQDKPHKQTSIYVYVTDSQQLFVEDAKMSTDVLYMKEKEPLVIPCRVTSPNVTTELVKVCAADVLSADQRNIIWNSRRGFTIRSPTFFYIALSPPLYKSRALKGQRLVLNCSATAELNTRVNFTWDYPGKSTNTGSTFKRLVKHQTEMLFYSILTIPKLQRSDRGHYTCRVTSGDQRQHKQVNVTVYDRPFIRLKPRNGLVMTVQAGEKSYKISPKLRAFPAPKVIWLKDGTVAAEQCSRYHMSGNSLVIRDVAEEDAGKYTVLVRNQEHRLYQNLTLTLVVNVSPKIGEKAVLLQDPASVPRGSRQALRCTSHGVPPPHIKWLWHPCPSKAEAFVSGVYRCIASNSAGADQLDIHFYITDVPGGFCVKQMEEAREGGDLRLTCLANKYLYTALSWQRMNNTEEAQSRGLNNQQFMVGDFSNSLVLLISNLTARDSGAYRCSARHIVTGQETHLETQVEVTILEPPVLVSNLTDCTVNVSSSVTLSCPCRGVPPPTITWYKDQRVLLQGSGKEKEILTPEEATLHIDRITAEDEGLYTCQATNERGSAESSAYIWVSGKDQSSFLEIPTLTCTCVVAALFWFLLTLFIRKMKQPNSSYTKTEYLSIVLDTGEGPIDEQCERLHYDPNQWEFPRERLKLGKLLGRGAFGKVMQASAFGINKGTSCKTVAVKMLKEGATANEHKALMTELKILNHIGNHLNVVNLLGACTKPGGPLMVIVEYCRFGNLSTFLKNKRDVFVQDRTLMREMRRAVTSVRPEPGEHFILVMNQTAFDTSLFLLLLDPQTAPNSPLYLEDLISFSFQVARGMEFLASRKCIHRDLAARNVLLSDNKVVKICDFGLARDIYKDPDYVRKGDARLPLKWMSPESIFDKVFTTQSDVWSYGILLWEIFSLGASPYPGLHIDEEFCHRLKGGTRMRAPEYSTPEIYSTMLACWEANAADRPTFTNLVETMGELLQARVQQDGKDYIPLGSFMTGESDRCEAFKENPQSISICVFRFFTFTKCRDTQVPFLCSDIAGLRENDPSILPCDWESDEGGSPPPDYNSAFLYPSL